MTPIDSSSFALPYTPDIDIRPRPSADTLMPLTPSSRCSIAISFSKKVEVFPLLPIAHFEVEAGDLGVLDPAVVLDEPGADAFAQYLVCAQVLHRLFERARKKVGLRLVRRVG